MFVGTVLASVAIDISPADSYDDSYTQMKKHMTVQLPIPGTRYKNITKTCLFKYTENFIAKKIFFR